MAKSGKLPTVASTLSEIALPLLRAQLEIAQTERVAPEIECLPAHSEPAQIVELFAQRNVLYQPRQTPVQQDGLAMVREHLGQLLAPRRPGAPQTRIGGNVFDVLVLRQQQRGGLVSEAGQPGNTVGIVA